MMKMKVAKIIAGFGVVAVTSFAQAVIIHDESVDGDLSGNQLAPTLFNANLGSNEVVGSMNRNIDIEYFTVVVQPGHQLDALVAAELVAPDGRSFIGVQSGSQFTVTPAAVQPSDLLGYAHFGFQEGNIGTNILDDMGSGFGAQGFTGSLSTGSYTFWLQNINDIASYRLDFQITAAVPEPGEYAMLLAGIAVLGLIARRRRIRFT